MVTFQPVATPATAAVSLPTVDAALIAQNGEQDLIKPASVGCRIRIEPTSSSNHLQIYRKCNPGVTPG